MDETTDDAPATWSPDELRAEVAGRTWFHTIDLGGGVVTPGYEDTPGKVQHMRIPADLTGRSVIDIGAYDGFFSFEAERRGAARVLATDKFAWTWPGNDSRRNFELARTALGSKVDDQFISVEELSAEAVGGVFDVALFLGVLYHSPDPLGYLRRLRSVTGELAVIETVVDLLDIDVPALAYYPGASFNHDASNYFGPNVAALRGMLDDAGFGRVEVFEPWVAQPMHTLQLEREMAAGRFLDRVIQKARGPEVRSGRLVVHAYV